MAACVRRECQQGCCRVARTMWPNQACSACCAYAADSVWHGDLESMHASVGSSLWGASNHLLCLGSAAARGNDFPSEPKTLQCAEYAGSENLSCGQTTSITPTQNHTHESRISLRERLLTLPVQPPAQRNSWPRTFTAPAQGFSAPFPPKCSSTDPPLPSSSSSRMAIKASIIGFAVIAFTGPILIFLAAAVLVRRLKQRKQQQQVGLNLGQADAEWPVALTQKSDPSKLPNLADVPLVIVSSKSSGSLGMDSSRGVRSAASAGSSTCSSRSSSPAATPMLLTPPPPAAATAPDSHTVVDLAAALCRLSGSQQGSDVQVHCTRSMPVSKGDVKVQVQPAVQQSVPCH